LTDLPVKTTTLELGGLIGDVVGFYGAFRFSEVNQLRFADVLVNRQGTSVAIHVAKSKTDQYSEGRNKGLSLNPHDPLLCPVGTRCDPKIFILTRIFVLQHAATAPFTHW